MTDFATMYAEILEKSGLAAYSGQKYARKFEKLLQMLTETNEKFNLTAITEPDQVILRHFADSLTAADLIGPAETVLDVGCGGGFPVLPLAVVRPDAAYTALDSTAKKLTFVDAAARALSLPVTTLAGRAEEIGTDPAYRERFDLVISRAVARLNVLCELCLPLTRIGGRFIAMKGAGGAAELAQARTAIRTLGGRPRPARTFTLAGAARMLIEVEKIAPTPKTYPRAFGKIKKNPL